MTMVEPGSLTASGGDTPAASRGPSGGGIASWSTGRKVAVGAGVIAVLGIGYLFLKKRSSAAAATASSGTNATTPTLVLPSSNQDVTASTDYASLATGLNNLSNQVSQIKSTNNTPTPTPPPQGPPSFPISYGAGIGNLDVIGTAQPGGAYKGYNVSGGAPVYAYVNGSWHIGLSPQQFQPNTPIGVPTQYADLINWQAGTANETLGSAPAGGTVPGGQPVK